MSHRMDYDVKQEIHDAGISVAAYVRSCGYLNGVWGGDLCGCSDDRCIGYHHEREDDCQCLPVLLGQALALG